MDRRNFIKVAAAGSAVWLVGCESNVQEPGWIIPESRVGDIRLQLLRYAILAPSSHNVQPWLVELSSDNAMRLYVDRGRLIPASDPPSRQIQQSQAR